MLSKLRYFRSSAGASPSAVLVAPDIPALQARLGPELARLEPVASGTLGSCFVCELGDREIFLKTNAVPNGRAFLEKEIDVFLLIYGANVRAERITVTEPGSERLWLLMDRLRYSTTDLEPPQCLDLTSSLEREVGESSGKIEDDFATLITEAEGAVSELMRVRLLSDRAAMRVAAGLRALRQAWVGLPRVLCHGDFGPMNIMHGSSGPVVVDWEDAFIGVPGYDYLYWLSFFQNRKHHCHDMLGRTILGWRLEVAVLALIVVVKCEISWRAGRHVGNALTFDQRLEEVFAFA